MKTIVGFRDLRMSPLYLNRKRVLFHFLFLLDNVALPCSTLAKTSSPVKWPRYPLPLVVETLIQIKVQ